MKHKKKERINNTDKKKKRKNENRIREIRYLLEIELMNLMLVKDIIEIDHRLF